MKTLTILSRHVPALSSCDCAVIIPNYPEETILPILELPLKYKPRPLHYCNSSPICTINVTRLEDLPTNKLLPVDTGIEYSS